VEIDSSPGAKHLLNTLMFHCPTSNRIRSSRSQQRAHQRIRQPVAGSAWILFLSLINVLVLNHTPDWVRARVLAISTLVFQGAVAVGSAAWGAVAVRLGIGSALLYAGAGTLAMTALALFLRLPDSTVDLSSWNHWQLPAMENGALPADGDFGPVLITGIPSRSRGGRRFSQSGASI